MQLKLEQKKKSGKKGEIDPRECCNLESADPREPIHVRSCCVRPGVKRSRRRGGSRGRGKGTLIADVAFARRSPREIRARIFRLAASRPWTGAFARGSSARYASRVYKPGN